MVKSFNKTILIGRLTNDVSFKGNDEDVKRNMALFDILTSRFDNGAEVFDTHRIYAFGKQAILCKDHLRKGDLCCIEGILDTNFYKNESRSNRILAERITFLRRPEETETNS